MSAPLNGNAPVSRSKVDIDPTKSEKIIKQVEVNIF
jgi:hypothetical protein